MLIPNISLLQLHKRPPGQSSAGVLHTFLLPGFASRQQPNMADETGRLCSLLFRRPILLDRLLHIQTNSEGLHKRGRSIPSGESYWAGFYTSRPTLKGFIREAEAFLQVGVHFLGRPTFSQIHFIPTCFRSTCFRPILS